MAIDQMPAKPGDAICQTHSDVHVVLASGVSGALSSCVASSPRTTARGCACVVLHASYGAVLRSALCTRPSSRDQQSAIAGPGAAKAWEIVWIHKVRLPFRMLRRVCLRIGAWIAGT
jgi:hypothetical protein